tara:strand:+ start:468 stop:617 length:150 start_codon:yes stop_codon:yes gene_type:complete
MLTMAVSTMAPITTASRFTSGLLEVMDSFKAQGMWIVTGSKIIVENAPP